MSADGGRLRTVGIVGAGKLGTVLARSAVRAGLRTLVSGRSDPAELGFILGVVAPGARATDTTTLVRQADVTILALPFQASRLLPYDAFEGRIVVDSMNYWEPVDGELGEVLGDERSTSEIVASRNPGARWVKTFNSLGYHDLEEAARPPQDPGRAGLGLAGDDAEAKDLVAHLVDLLGFDPVDVGPLTAGRVLQPGAPMFGRVVSRRTLHDLTAPTLALQVASRP